MPSRLADRLLASGLVPLDDLRAAVARQSVYGGALDSALLELGAIAEATLWRVLSEATGLAVPERALCEAPQRLVTPDGAGAFALDVAWSIRCRAVPVGLEDGVLQILCGEPIARAALDEATRTLATPVALFVAPEIWIAAVRQVIYDRPMAPRLVRLFARVVGAQPVRRWQAAHTPPPPSVPPEPPVEIPAPAAPTPAAPTPAAATLPASTTAPVSPPEPSPPPPSLDKGDVPSLIERLEQGNDVEAARAALVAITKQDFGAKPKRWAGWWEQHQDDDRIDWLFDGLAHRTPEIRAAAEQELRALTGEYFGYAFDLPRAAREAARARWMAWWRERPAKRLG